MDLRCPKCNGTDLEKVSRAYEEGLLRSEGRARIRGVLVGSGGPDVVVGSATTRGTHQTALSKRLNPPTKWSYLRLVVGFTVISLIALIVYIHNVMTSSSVSASLPVKLYGWIASSIFALLVFVTWKHNHSTYPRQIAEWGRSYFCEQCGAVTVL